MKIVRVPPSGGKSYLVDLKPDLYVDSDKLVQVLGFHPTKAGVESLRASGGWDRDLVSSIVGSRTLLTNFDPNWLCGVTAHYDVVNVKYKPEEYVAHIKHVGRADLLNNFSERELESWMSFDATIELPIGSFVSDIEWCL